MLRDGSSSESSWFGKEIFGLFLLFGALLLLLSLVTFDPADPSINHSVSGGGHPANKAGLFGAYASGFLNDLFGSASLLLPFAIGGVGASFLSRSFTMTWWRWCGFALLSLCVLTTSAAWNIGLGDLSGGGLVGGFLAHTSSLFLSSFGAVLLWLFCFFVGLQLFFNLSWKKLCQEAGEIISDYAQRRREAAEAGQADADAGGGGGSGPFGKAARLLGGMASLTGFLLQRLGGRRAASAPMPDIDSALPSTGSGSPEPRKKRKSPKKPRKATRLDQDKDAPFASLEDSLVPADSPFGAMYAKAHGLERGAEPADGYASDLDIEPASYGADQPQGAVPDDIFDGQDEPEHEPRQAAAVKEEVVPWPVDDENVDLPGMPGGDSAALPARDEIQQPQPRLSAEEDEDDGTPDFLRRPEDDRAEPAPARRGAEPAPAAEMVRPAGPAAAAMPATPAHFASSASPARLSRPAPAPKPAAGPAKTLKLPPLELLEKPAPAPARSAENIEERGAALMQCLKDFNIRAELVEATPGPVVTTYMLRPDRGVSVRIFSRHADDIALSLKAVSVFVQAPVPGTDTVGIVLPNQNREIVNFRDIAQSRLWLQDSSNMALPLIIGKDPTGKPFVADLAKMPHLLVAGATGQGKSVCLNAMLSSLILRKLPTELKLVLVDPKRVEMGIYEDESHLIHPVVKEVEDARNALQWAVHEMTERYTRMSRLGVRNIIGYNEKLKLLGDTLPPDLADLEPMPYIVIVIDELADLMMQCRKEVEPSIIRLAQLARAAGIHLIIATQRPSVDVVTGLIKANFPCRICFKVSQRQDSMTTLNAPGAEKLLGNGDMFYMPNGGSLQRLHGPFLKDAEVQELVSFWKRQYKPQYEVDFSAWGADDGTAPQGGFGASGSGGADAISADSDPLYREILDFVFQNGTASTSLLQRRFRIGFNKAARYMDQLDKDNLLGPSPGAGKPRPVVNHL
ncbi:MAG: DNA translocase FtsK [Desulfovibrio sp.]|nr:DNA translocase FtsK [Desulfovibrio sp.]